MVLVTGVPPAKVEGLILVLLALVLPLPGTEPAVGAQQIFEVTSNGAGKSPGDKIKHLDYVYFLPFSFPSVCPFHPPYQLL